MREAAEAPALKAEGRAQRVTGTVRITSSAVVANLLLPPILVALSEAEPSLQVELAASDLRAVERQCGPVDVEPGVRVTDR